MMPYGSELAANSGANEPSRRATTNATAKPPNRAMPPTSGVVTLWTRRASGSTTQPTRRANQATSGVRANVVTAARPPIAR